MKLTKDPVLNLGKLRVLLSLMVAIPTRYLNFSVNKIGCKLNFLLPNRQGWPYIRAGEIQARVGQI